MTLPTDADIAELVAYLPRLYAEGFKPTLRWYGGERNAGGAIVMPYPVYDPVVEAFYRLVAQPCWLDYDYDPAQAQRMVADRDLVRHATLEQIRTMLTYCLRGERFSDGHWEAMIERGVIRALLERLAEIRRERAAA